MTQKEILEIIGQKQPDYHKKAAKTWLKKHPIFVKELDPEIVANQYLNELKEQARISSLEGKKGILLGTIDRKFSRSTKIQKIFADILTEDGLERFQWWGSIPKENKTMQTLPILKECVFFGGMTDPWTAPDGSEWTNFDVEAITPSKKDAIAPNELEISSAEIINPDTSADNIMEGKYVVAIFGKIATIRPYQEKSWDDNEGAFIFGAEHPLFMSGNLCLTMGIRVNEDLYVKAHFPEQKLGWPTWIISNSHDKINGVKQVLAAMPVNATTERKMATQLLNQLNTVTSIFKGFSVIVIGEAKITQSESTDEVRTFIDIFPSFISISASDEVNAAEAVQTILETGDPQDLADEEQLDETEPEEPEESESAPVTIEVPTGLTEAKLIYEAVNDLGSQGEALAKAKVKELKQQYERLNIEIDIGSLIKLAAKELNVDITGYEKKQVAIEEQQIKEKKAAVAKAKAIAKKKQTPGKKKATKKDKWAKHYQYINEVLGTLIELKDDESADTSQLPLGIWDILLDSGYCFEPEEGKILVTGGVTLQLDVPTKKILHKFFNKNPILQLRPTPIEDIDKAVREKLTALKAVVPSASPEHLMPMLASDNIKCPIELVTQIWESL